MSEHDFSDGLMDGAELAGQMFEGIPGALRVRMAMDVMASAITSDERTAIEELLRAYLDEAFIIEKDFNYEEALGV